MVLVTGVQGLALDFQNTPDFSEHVIIIPGSGVGTWQHSATGGNSYIYTTQGARMLNADPLLMTYAACSLTGTSSSRVRAEFYDSSMINIGAITSNPFNPFIIGNRVEITISGGTVLMYVNGVLDPTASETLTQNPSYIGWGQWDGTLQGYFDDCIWGDTESKYIFGMPESGYFLMKDILNPAASGFYRANQTDPVGAPTLITSSTFTSTFGKPATNNESITLSSPTGGTQQIQYTNTAMAGVITWNLTAFFETAPYGLYQTDINPQTNSSGYATSDWIPFIGSGASIQYDKNSYSVGENAVLTVIVSDSYYDTSTYAYHVVIQDIYGTEVYDEPISFSALSPYTGTATYQWSEDDDEGVYYGSIYATRLSDDVELLMNYDTADLNSLLVINGYVFDAQNATVLSGALVNWTQGVTTDALTSAADGNYTTTSAFVSGAPTSLVASAVGFETYTHTFTPLRAGTIQINISLMPTSPIYAGNAIGGLARSPPYNNTIASAQVEIVNGTDYNATLTNAAGYYIKNNLSESVL